MAEIIWYRSAVVQLRQILTYGSREFGKSAAIKLYRKIRKSVRLIANNPQMGSAEQLFAKQPESGIKSFAVHKNYKLVYKADIKDDNTIIYIIDIWDVRANPELLANRVEANL